MFVVDRIPGGSIYYTIGACENFKKYFIDSCCSFTSVRESSHGCKSPSPHPTLPPCGSKYTFVRVSGQQHPIYHRHSFDRILDKKRLYSVDHSSLDYFYSRIYVPVRHAIIHSRRNRKGVSEEKEIITTPPRDCLEHAGFYRPTLSTRNPSNSISLTSTTPLPSKSHLGFFI